MPIDQNETLSRFLVSSNQFRSSDQTVTFNAFIPSKKTKSLSVFRTSTLSECEIWSIGHNFVAEPRGKTLYGRADLFAQDVYAVSEEVQPETSTHCLHADIVRWPDKRDDIRYLATQLARQSKFIPNPIM